MATRGKFSYDRSYYENLSRSSSFDGNAARQLKVVPASDYDFEDEWDEEYDEEYEEEYEGSYSNDACPEEEVYDVPEEPQRKRQRSFEYDSEIDRASRQKFEIEKGIWAKITVFGISLAVIAVAFFQCIDLKSKLNQTSIQIKSAQASLDDIRELNESLATALDTEIDRNYIYTVAVGKLGMVYPNENQIVTYSPADTGYVRQMSYIPGN